MISKAKSNISLAKTIQYNEKEKATLVYTHKLEGENIQDFQTQMQDLQRCYTGSAKQLTIHAILSPSIEDGKHLQQKDWQKIADEYLKKMNLSQHQAIGFIHVDKEHRHLHLVINKVNEKDFTLYHDGFIGKKSQKVADMIAGEIGITRARQVQQERLKTKQRNQTNEGKPIGAKQKFEHSLKRITQTKFRNTEDYFKALEQRGFKVHKYTSKATNELRGYGIEKDGTKMDASAVNKQFTLKALGLTTENNIAKEKEKEKIYEPIEQLKDVSKIVILKNYAEEIGISKEIFQDERIKFLQQGNAYFIGMQNDGGGYTTVNPFSQNNIGERDITTIIESKDEQSPTIVVENIMDYFQYKQQAKNIPQNFIILNGENNKDKAVQKIESLGLRNIEPHFSNDSFGKILMKEFLKALSLLLSIDDSNSLSYNNEMPEPPKKKKRRRISR